MVDRTSRSTTPRVFTVQLTSRPTKPRIFTAALTALAAISALSSKRLFRPSGVFAHAAHSPKRLFRPSGFFAQAALSPNRLFRQATPSPKRLFSPSALAHILTSGPATVAHSRPPPSWPFRCSRAPPFLIISNCQNQFLVVVVVVVSVFVSTRKLSRLH